MGIAVKARHALGEAMKEHLDPVDRSEHMLATYFWLRQCVAWIGVLLPAVLLCLAWKHHDLRDSMSAYYYESAGVRDLFVGSLVAVGALLFSYKGFSDGEDVWLNIAALLLIGVALHPMQDPECVTDCADPSLHGAFAVGFFVCIAIVILRFSATTLILVTDTRKRKRLIKVYKRLGVGMLLLPFVAWALRWFKMHQAIFLVEAFGVWLFSAYWFVKTHELQHSGADKKVIEKTPLPPGGSSSAD